MVENFDGRDLPPPIGINKTSQRFSASCLAFGSVIDGPVESSDFGVIKLILPIILRNNTRFF